MRERERQRQRERKGERENLRGNKIVGGGKQEDVTAG